MTEELAESIRESPSIRPPGRRINLKLIALVLAILLIFISIPAAIYLVRQRRELRKEVGQPVSEISKLTNLEIVEKVLGWIDKKRDERGVYFFSEQCEINGKCGKSKDNRAGLAAIWGRFKYYQKSKNEKSLAIIDKDLNIYTDREKVKVIQNDFWNCKFMYEMWQSGLFSEGQKKQVEQICFGSGYLPLDLTWMDQAEFTQYSAFASDFVARYLWKKEDSDLEKAKAYFEASGEFWRKNPEGNPEECLLGIASLDLYKVVQEKNYFDLALQVWEKAKEKNYLNHLRKTAICSIFSHELYRLTKEQKYKDFKEKILQDLIDNNFDYPGYDGYLSGEGCFYSKGVSTIDKFVRENGLMVGILTAE